MTDKISETVKNNNMSEEEVVEYFDDTGVTDNYMLSLTMKLSNFPATSATAANKLKGKCHMGEALQDTLKALNKNRDRKDKMSISVKSLRKIPHIKGLFVVTRHIAALNATSHELNDENVLPLVPVLERLSAVANKRRGEGDPVYAELDSIAAEVKEARSKCTKIGNKVRGLYEVYEKVLSDKAKNAAEALRLISGSPSPKKRARRGGKK